MGWYVYILECKDGSWYTGITNDLDARILAHEEGRGAKYTRGRGPFKLIDSAEFESRSSASRAEAQVKRAPRRSKLARLAQLRSPRRSRRPSARSPLQ